jgi:adenylate kinase family enzyme
VRERIVIFGNSGSGKTTLAQATAGRLGVRHLDLDAIAWESPRVRRALPDSVALLEAFMVAEPGWVIEGCYGELVAAAAKHCTVLWFLNPGVEVCVANCRNRPWEPSKYATAAEQDALLEFLVSWVRQYETRDDEYGLVRHRAVFDGFPGPKVEYRQLPG